MPVSCSEIEENLIAQIQFHATLPPTPVSTVSRIHTSSQQQQLEEEDLVFQSVIRCKNLDGCL